LVGALLDGGKSGAWDVAFVGYSPERAEEWNFTALHLEIKLGYLIPSSSSISTMADMDRPGIRVAVQEKSQPEVFLSRMRQNAVVGPSIKPRWHVGAAEIRRSRRHLQYQAKLVRGVESIAGFSCSRTVGPASIRTQ
jgi:Bacterial extracellular solute-binding proteins, family 3